jgi:hypothetical protein
MRSDGTTPTDKLPIPTLRPNPQNIELEALSNNSGSSPVLLSLPSSRPHSRTPSPFTLVASSSSLSQRNPGAAPGSAAAARDRTVADRSEEEEETHDDEDFGDWDVDYGDSDEDDSASDMPSDLRPHRHHDHASRSAQPLLGGNNKDRQSYDSPPRPSVGRRSTLHERDPAVEARNATRRRYMYAGCFLLLSLVSFAVQTETAVYIQSQLHWEKAYCML